MPFPSALLFLLLRQEEEERKGMRTRVSFCFVSLCDARGDVGRRFLRGASSSRRPRFSRRSSSPSPPSSRPSDLGSIIPKHSLLAEGAQCLRLRAPVSSSRYFVISCLLTWDVASVTLSSSLRQHLTRK